MSAGRVAYLADPRPCGGCGHGTGEHWTESTASFACTRPGCGCRGWWSMADLVPDDDGVGDEVEGGWPGCSAGPGWVGPPVVTVCGSMRFWPLMVAVPAAETAAGVIVLAPFVVVPTDGRHAERSRLDALHRAKIVMSSSVLVVTDRSGYWGESTHAEIGYALGLGVAVRVRVVDRVTGAQTTHGLLGWESR